MKKILLILSGLWAVCSPISAEESVDPNIASAIVAQLKLADADIEYGDVTTSPIAGLYRVQIVDGPALYVSADGRHFVLGELYQAQPGQFVNLTQRELDGKRKELLAALSVKDMIVFSPEGKVKAVVNVFTDVDCGYCRKFHQQVPALNEKGIEVRYLAYPRAGVHSNSYRKIVSAWCADDPRSALTQLKNGLEVPENLCADNPVADQYQLGRDMGISGTPSLVLADGTLLVGYRPVDELAKLLGI